MHALDHCAEKRFLGFEMMIERLPRQACGLRRLLDRGTAKTVPAKYRHRGIQNAVARAHLTNLTLVVKTSNHGFAMEVRSCAAPPVRLRDQSFARYAARNIRTA